MYLKSIFMLCRLNIICTHKYTAKGQRLTRVDLSAVTVNQWPLSRYI